jgi:predicted aspartyl protease
LSAFSARHAEISAREAVVAVRMLMAGVPIQVIRNTSYVAATINGGGSSALLIVDTGADRTILTPRLLDRLGVIVPADAPRRKIRVVGGQTLDVPFMKIAMLGVGDAMIKNPEIGVYEILPDEPIVDGLLGGDCLQRFRVTLDRTAKHMRLEQLRK